MSIIEQILTTHSANKSRLIYRNCCTVLLSFNNLYVGDIYSFIHHNTINKIKRIRKTSFINCQQKNLIILKAYRNIILNHHLIKVLINILCFYLENTHTSFMIKN